MDILIYNSSDEPIYSQIVNQIKDHIMYGKLKKEQMLPSIRGLAKELGISVITTKRAYDELEKEGLIATIPGKGSYVASENLSMIQETRLKLIEDKLSEAVRAAKSIDLSYKEISGILKLLYEEE